MKLTHSKQRVLFALIGLILAGLFIGFLSGKTDSQEYHALPESVVSIVQSPQAHAQDINEEEIKAMVREAVALAGGFEGLIFDGQVIVIKPNLVTINDYTLPGWRGVPLAPEFNGTTTDWRVTKAVVELVRERNPTGKVYIMEGSSTRTKSAMRHYHYTPEYIPGVDEFIAIEEDSGKWREYDSPYLCKVDLPNGLLNKTYYLNKRYKEADLLISIACLKTHWHAAVTGGVKNVGIGATPANIYGISSGNVGRNNMVDHERDDLHKWIHDFYLCRPVDFVILDGLQGIQNGPTPCYEVSRTTDLAQDQMNMRMILAGRDAIAVDTISALVMGWDPYYVNYLRYLNRSGMGNLDTAFIKVAGKKVDEVRKNFAGVIPPAGGKKIDDQTAPLFSIEDLQVNNGNLSLTLACDEDAHKVEVYLNDALLKPTEASPFKEYSFDLSHLKPGSHQIEVCVYDRFLNRSTQRREITLKETFADGDYLAFRASKPPVIDGLGDDECWKKASWAPIANLWLGSPPSPADFSGRYKIVWAPEKLYFLVEIIDDILHDIDRNPLVDYWKYDCLEIFIDEDRSGGDHTYNHNAFAYHISIDYNIADLGVNRNPILLTDHAKVRRTQDGALHTWEVALDVYDDTFDEYASAQKPLTLSAQKTLGFAVAYCDNDGGNDRESFIGSIHIPGIDKNVAWQDAGVFGALTLVD